LEPDELDRAITLARTAATARGNGVKEPTETELENRHHIRKSLNAARDLEAGERLTAETVSVLRPTDGLSPTRYEDVLGREAATALDAGDPITEPVLAEDAE